METFSMSTSHFLALKDLTADTMHRVISEASRMKSGTDTGRHLADKNLALLFTVPSTRTRASFQVGARQLGAYAEYLDVNDLQIKNGECLQDTAAVLGRFFDMLIVRMYDMRYYRQGHVDLETIARYANIPVINALDDLEHPCQVMADLLTLKEYFGDDFTNRRVVMSWGYTSRKKSPGVLHSMLAAGSLLGMKLTFAYPKGYDLDPEYVDFAAGASNSSGATIEFSNDLNEACEGADVVYVKGWKCLTATDEEDESMRQSVRADWRLSESHYQRANAGALYMDCMPFIRGEQVTAEVADGPRSIIYNQAENRLHAQKAIMAFLTNRFDGA
jgi:ornithine carbamoyltransferase